MGVSTTTVGLVCTAIVLLFTIACYYLFFHEPSDSVSDCVSECGSGSSTTNNKNNAKKKSNATTTKSHLKPSAIKGYNAKAALSHATDCKSHSLYWRELGGHVVTATCVAFSHPQHDIIASGSIDGSIRCVRISDLGTPLPCEVYTKMTNCIPNAISFTQNAKRLIVASNDGNIYFYGISVTQKSRKIELVKSFSCNLKQVHSLQLLDVEQWMVVVVSGISAVDNTPAVQAYNPKGQLINEYLQVKRSGRADKNRQPNAKKALIVSSPDDRFIAISGCGESSRTVGDGEVGIFEVERDSAGHTKGLKLSFVLAGHTSEVSSMAWNATGEFCMQICA